MFTGLGLLFLAPFLVWGDWWERFLAPEAAVAMLERAGPWGWLLGIALLVGDLLLPLPSTVVISALGLCYGPWVGGLVGGAGSMLAGFAGYGACRALGEPAVRFLLGERDLERGRRFFAGSGAWVVALSRWLPLLPEVVSCFAGLNRMPSGRFAFALACGSLPMALVWAWVGSVGRSEPGLMLLASGLAPVLLWGLASALLRRSGH